MSEVTDVMSTHCSNVEKGLKCQGRRVEAQQPDERQGAFGVAQDADASPLIVGFNCGYAWTSWPARRRL
jgi:hypothetical protein